jgi:iron complex outermembrane receptor protein
VDARFNTLGIKHAITGGVNGYHQTNASGIFNCPNNMGTALTVGKTVYSPLGNGTSTFTTLCQYQFDEPISNGTGLPDGSAGDTAITNVFNYYTGIMAKTGVTKYFNATIGDDITVNRWVELLAGETHTTITSESFSTVTGTGAIAGLMTADYSKQAWTPSFSLVVKPLSWARVYGTYIQALTPGSTAPLTYTIGGKTYSYVNGGQALPPVRNHEYETGIKADINKHVLATVAYFHTNVATYGSSNPLATSGASYIQNDRQLVEGLEFTAQGRLTKDLTIVGGGTHAHYIYTNEPTFAQDGTEPSQTPTDTQKLTLEYATPFTFAKGLIVTGGVYHTGEQYANGNNESPISGYTLVDLGGRYSKHLEDRELIFRLNATNVGNVKYWPDSRTPGMPFLFNCSTTFRF